MTTNHAVNDSDNMEAELKEWYQNWFLRLDHENRNPRGILQSLWDNKVRAFCFLTLYSHVAQLCINSVSQIDSNLQVVMHGIAGIFMADLLLGVFHMICDSYPISPSNIRQGKLGDSLAFWFQLHHAHKLDWCHYNLFYRGILVAGLHAGMVAHVLFRLAQLCIYLWLASTATNTTDTPLMSPATIWTWQAFLWAATISQITHAAAHNRWDKDSWQGQVYRRFLEGIWVVSRESHQLHHTHYNCNYCITTGWANPIVNWICLTFVEPHIDKTVSSETSQHVYGNGSTKNGSTKNTLQEPYYEIFPEWRVTQLNHISKKD